MELTEARQLALTAAESVRYAQEQLSVAAQSALSVGLMPVFEKYPFLGSICWTQYTPYFNDGDVCEFTSCIGEPALNSVQDVEEGSTHDYYENGYHFSAKCEPFEYGRWAAALSKYVEGAPNPHYDDAYGECEKYVRELLREFSGAEFTEALRAMFGDHAIVTVTREGFIVDHYEHD